MASADENVERIKLEAKFEAKKELLLSIKGLQTFIREPCVSAEEVRCHKCNRSFWVKCNNKYEEDGCQEVLMKEDMIEHEQCCVYRPINCADLKCTQKTTYSGFMEHLAEIHKELYESDVIDTKRFFIKCEMDGDFKSRKFTPTRISVFDFTFFEVGIIKDQFMFRWICILGDPDVAENFFYNVKVKKENTRDELTFCGQVRSLSEHYEYITKSFNAFFMPIVKMKEFLDGDSKLSLEYQICNMKNEAKDDNEESGISDDNE